MNTKGVCIQLWNTYACDCDMTSYTGPNCAEDSTAYRFGPKPGLITYTFAEDKRPDTKNDLLAVGFITSVENAVLLRIDSGTSSDYMELQLVDGSLLMVYNLGLEDLSLGHLGLPVNDDRYHIVRFTRSGPNATLQVDNHNVLATFPPGKQLTIFNAHSKLQIGGKRNTFRENVIEKPFHGIIAGLVFNGEKVLDFAAESDPKLTSEGSVELLIALPTAHPGRASGITPAVVGGSSHLKGRNMTRTKLKPHQIMQQHAKNGLYEGDELILSGDGSGCWDDEDCAALTIPSGDDLITPFVSVAPPTPSSGRKHTTTTVQPSAPPICDEDDEDCLEGSGSGAVEQTHVVGHVVLPLAPPPAPSFSWPSPPSYPVTPQRATINPARYPTTSTTEEYDNTYLYTFKPIPPPDPPPTYQSYRPKPPTPPRPTGPPVIVDVPKPHVTHSVTRADQKHKTSNTMSGANSSADRTAMIIGLIAVIIVIIVIITPLTLFLKVRYQAGLVMTNDKNLRFSGVSGTPPMLHTAGVQFASQTLLNGDGSNHSTPAKMCHASGHDGQLMAKKKNLKEWYV